jgi:hypothetical protein
MAIYDGNVTCGRVSSIFVYNSAATRYVEVGWYENPAGVYNCLPVTNGPPKVLAFYLLDGVAACWGQPSTLSGGTTAGFWVDDNNQDAIWNFFYAGTNVYNSGKMSTFTTGILVNNGERLNTDNTAHADFDGMKRMNSSQQWVDWTSATYSSNDSGMHGCYYSATHQAVKEVGTAC